MTSEPPPAEAFVWVWLPGAVEPVVAGRLEATGDIVTFNYGQSYLNRRDSIALYLPELPLRRGVIAPIREMHMAGCVADAGPDAWGQRMILRRIVGAGAQDTGELTPLAYLLQSGSDRVGALDVQRSATDYVPRETQRAPLSELAEAAERVQAGVPFTPALDQALLHGSSVGGARPKALLDDGDRRMIAKFSASADPHPVVKGEFVAMELARRTGLDVAPVQLTSALGRDVLLVERFDRRPGNGERRPVVSALTMLELDEMLARYASYADLAQVVRERFSAPRRTLRELFGRLTFNVLVGNTDDHARNHAAFWDGRVLTLTPAYDICPQPRGGGEASQGMIIRGDGFRLSQVGGCLAGASDYLLSEADAREIVDRQIDVITSEWREVCDLAEMTEVDRGFFWRRQFLNPYALEGY